MMRNVKEIQSALMAKLARALTVCLLLAVPMPTHAGLFWDAAVARHAQLIGLCANFVSGMSLEAFREAAAVPGPLQKEVTVKAGTAKDVITLMDVAYVFDHAAAVPSCMGHATHAPHSDGDSYLLRQAYLKWRNSLRDTASTLVPGKADGHLVFTPETGAAVLIETRSGNIPADLPVGLHFWMSPAATPLVAPKTKGTP